MRWVDCGFQTVKSLLSQPGGKEQKRAIDGEGDSRLKWSLGLFSKVDEIADDRESVFGMN